MSTNLRTFLSILLLSNFTNFGNYLFQIFLGRNLSPSAFGIFNTVSALGLIIGFFAPVIPNVVSKFLIQNSGHEKRRVQVLSFFLRCSVLSSLIVTLSMIASSPLLAKLVQVPSAIPIIIFSFSIGTMIWIMMLQGILITNQRYLLFTSHLTAHTLIKLVLVVVVVLYFSGGYNAALAVVGVANIVVIISLIGYSTDQKKGTVARWKLPKGWDSSLINGGKTLSLKIKKDISLFFGPSTVAQLIYTLMTNVDIIIVQALTSPKEAGEYSFAAILARVAIFLPQMLLSVLFPELVRNTNNRKILAQTTLLTLLTSGSYWAILYLSRDFSLTLIFGPQAKEATTLIGYITGAMVLFALTNILFQKNLALDRYKFLAPTLLSITLGTVVSTVIVEQSAYGVAQAMFWINGLLLFVLLVWEGLNSKDQKMREELIAP